MSNRKRVYLFLSIVALIATALYFAGSYLDLPSAQAESRVAGASEEDTGPREDTPEDATPVELARVTTGPISSFLSSTANLRALRQVDIVSQSEGLAEALLVEEGEAVGPDQVLARLDDSQLRIRQRSASQKLAQARLQLEKARIRREKAATQIANSREELARYQRLFKDKLVSEREVAQLQYRVEELVHDERVASYETRELAHRVDELKAETDEIELQIEQTVIRAPFAGTITTRTVEVGQMVKRLDPLFRLGSFDELYADVFLSEKEAGRVVAGQPARIVVAIPGVAPREGRVVRISPVVDESTGTVKVTLRLRQSQHAFKPGAFVRIAIETDRRELALLVPKRAVLEEDGRHFVFVSREDRAHRVEIRPGYQSDTMTEVLDGLSAGDQVVVAGQGSLQDAGPIRPVNS